MKSNFANVLTLCIAALLAGGSASQALPRLTVGVVRGFPGRTADVPVSLRYRTNDLRDVVALQADVVFDATGITDRPPASGVMISNHVLFSSAPVAGTRRLLLYSTSGATLTNGDLARILFSVGPGEYRNFALRLTNVILVRANASRVPGDITSGAVAVNQVFLTGNGLADGFLNVASNGVEQCYVIQATQDFNSWSNVQTNTTEEALLPFLDPDAGEYARRFYRAVLCEAEVGAARSMPRVQVGTITQLPEGQVQFDFTGVSGRRYVIQTSTDLMLWQDLRSDVGLNGPMTFTDSFTNFIRRFYRVRAVQ